MILMRALLHHFMTQGLMIIVCGFFEILLSLYFENNFITLTDLSTNLTIT